MSNSLDQARHSIWVQTVCKEYQQMTYVGIERVKHSHTCMQHFVSCGATGQHCSGSVGRGLDWGP